MVIKILIIHFMTYTSKHTTAQIYLQYKKFLFH